MKLFGVLLLGFFGVLLAFTLFGSLGLVSGLCCYAIALTLLFFVDRTTWGYPYLIGTIIGFELFTTYHIGTGSLFGLITLGLEILFGQMLRLTSLATRYIVALFALGICFNLTFYPFSGFWHRLGPTILTSLLIAGATLLMNRSRTKPEYELL